MTSKLENQNIFINYSYLVKNNVTVRKRKKKSKNFFLKLNLHKKILEKNKYKEIIYNQKKNYFSYRKNKIKYLKRKFYAKQDTKLYTIK